jgi:hypothetical protein
MWKAKKVKSGLLIIPGVGVFEVGVPSIAGLKNGQRADAPLDCDTYWAHAGGLKFFS